jgi:hypothetical protein
MPFKAPSKPPHPIAIALIASGPNSGLLRLSNATVIPLNAKFAATDRSIPRTRMTSI